MAAPIIEFKNFTFQYNAQAEPTLHNIDLTIHRGEKVLVCGPSGCGKSTLSHCLNGLIPASYPGKSDGELLIDGKSFKDLDIFSLSKIVGTVLQDQDGQFIGLTVGEDIAFALENDCTDLRTMKQKVLQAAKRVGMEAFLDHAPHQLSGGQKQRVSFAGVMVDNVSLFLFDEPLANLDPATGKSTIELIDEIHRSTGATIVIIEHRLEDVLHCHVDRTVLMSDGRIISDTDADTLLSGDLLSKNGIREPLYVTALKYAGVKITKDMHPSSIAELTLSDSDKEKVRSWFRSIAKASDSKTGEIALQASGICFAYDGGHKALENIDLAIRHGEMMSIVGKNGAGKSTFSKVVCGFERQCSGKLLLDGNDMDSMSIRERALHIGYVMQNPNQMITKTMISDEVGLGLVMEGRLTKEQIAEKVNKVLTICGLYPFRNWPISALSFGQKKRVTIASILAMDPQMIILDEPTAGQDLRHYTEIMEFLKGLNNLGITIVLITHDMHLMLEYSERAAVFCDGKLIADARAEEILTNDALIEKANLKKTSLSALADICGIPANAFIRAFIQTDREMRQ